MIVEVGGLAPLVSPWPQCPRLEISPRFSRTRCHTPAPLSRRAVDVTCKRGRYLVLVAASHQDMCSSASCCSPDCSWPFHFDFKWPLMHSPEPANPCSLFRTRTTWCSLVITPTSSPSTSSPPTIITSLIVHSRTAVHALHPPRICYQVLIPLLVQIPVHIRNPLGLVLSTFAFGTRYGYFALFSRYEIGVAVPVPVLIRKCFGGSFSGGPATSCGTTRHGSAALSPRPTHRLRADPRARCLLPPRYMPPTSLLATPYRREPPPTGGKAE